MSEPGRGNPSALADLRLPGHLLGYPDGPEYVFFVLCVLHPFPLR